MTRVTMTKEEMEPVGWNIVKFYDLVATKMGRDPKDIRYDCREIDVSKPVQDIMFNAVEAEIGRGAIGEYGMMWVCSGPKTNIESDEFIAEVTEKFIIEPGRE